LDQMGKELEALVDDELKAGRKVSMAALQGMFIRNDAKDALAGCRELFVKKRTP